MNRIQNGKNRNPEKPISGCLGRMVNLFDLNTNVGGNKLLTEEPHNDGSAFTRTSPLDDQMLSESRKSQSNKKSNGTPIKMLIAQEMSKEDESKQSPSNLVAKLMGLDTLPQQQQQHSRTQSGSMEFLQQEHEITKCPEKEEFKDVYEIYQQHYKEKHNDRKSEGNMDLIREKFMEAKRLSTDETKRQSKQFQDALEVLSSNKDLFLKFLQEPNSLFSQHLYNLQSVPPPTDSRRITVLRPSKLVETQNKNKNKNKTKTDSDFIFSPKSDENPTQPTRIVILKPHNVKLDVFDEDQENLEVSESREEITNEISDNLSELRRDETLLSSVFSNGYVGDDSSFCKSEVDYGNGNVSDSEVVSPISRHSWEYINRFNSHYSTSSSRGSYSPESSVCKEAKKRLSERWAMVASNKNVVEQRQIQRSSSTLGDMLALSDLKKSVKVDEKDKISEIEEEFVGSSDLNKRENDDNTPRNLPRSKSVPGLQVSESLEGKGDETKEKLVKSLSFKGRVSSLFFSKNKKKEKSNQSKDVTSSRNEGSQCVNGMVVEDESCTRLYRSQGIILPEAGFSFTKPEIPGNNGDNQDQPSPISVLEPHFEEDVRITISNRHGIEPMKYNLIDKSPPIGSISRTLSWDDTTTLGSSTRYTGKPLSSAPLNPQQEEQECLFYVQTLLQVSRLDKIQSTSLFARWHSPDSPLDPSLRHKYMNQTEKENSILSHTKQRHHQSMTKLVFDCVNEALMDFGNVGMVMTSALLGECVWARMKEWLYSGEERWEWEEGDGGGCMVVEEVVRKEVVGRGWWVEGLRLEGDVTRKEIEGKLLEELVEESVLELTGRA